jgi:tetratricopeptide (TPR) repeat protein
MLPAGIAIAQFIGEFIAEKFLEDNVLERFKENQIKREVATIIERTFRETIIDFPDAEYILNNLDIKSFMSDAVVQDEISKLIKPEGSSQPISDTLKERWLKHLSGQSGGNFQIIIDRFLSKLKRNLWEIKELRELLHQKQQDEMFEFIKSNLPSQTHPISEVSSNIPSTIDVQFESEKTIVQKIELCKSLLRQGFPTASLSQLRSLETDLQNQPISNLTRSKFFALIGVCNLDLGNFDIAIENFSRAYKLSPKDPDAIANMAVVNLFNGMFDDAIKLADEAISLKPIGTNARAVKFESFVRKGNFESVDELIEENLLDDPNYARTVGIVLSSLTESSKAEKYLRLGIAQSPEDFYVGMSLCKVLIDKVSFIHKHPAEWVD